MRKRIAVLVAQIDENTQKRFLTEFIRQAYGQDYDVCIFTMHQKYQETELRDIGDANIFELVNYDLFDAVLIMLDTILNPAASEGLLTKIKENFKGPVLVIDQECPYFESVMMDHYTPVHKLVDHLIEVHGYKDIAYLSGKKGHIHSVQRLNAYLDSMKEHGLPVREEWIYHGNYWYDSAEKFVEQLLEDREHLPRALACANDIMAIGAAAKFVENGIRVPEDIAVVGYDSIEDGRQSPKPITSADIPAPAAGRYSLHYLVSKIEGKEPPVFDTEAPLFIGNSCGCNPEVKMVPYKLRETWQTEQSSGGVYSDFNHMIEDLFCQTDIRGFLTMVFNYSRQILPFHSFHVCLNDTYLAPEYNIGENARRKGYSEKMYEVIRRYGQDESEGGIYFNHEFDTKLLLPAMHEERDYPTTYIFNPLYCDDRCFGYSVLNYGREVRLYDEGFRVWIRNVTQGMESFYRKQYVEQLIRRIRADQVRDSLTGLYNYLGFLKNAEKMLAEMEPQEEFQILAIDMKGVTKINELYGRQSGDKALQAVARFISETAQENEIVSRMSNDEFLVCFQGGQERQEQITSNVLQKIKDYRLSETSDFQLDINYAALGGKASEIGSLEGFINHIISIKNHKKRLANQAEQMENDEIADDIKRNQLVDYILNENLLTYYFQPIVRVKDGKVAAFEALMRYEKEKISPFQILRAAEYLDRLYDIEKSTITNVVRYYDENAEQFGDAKVFMNSLPAHQLNGEDAAKIADILYRRRGRFVVEFTEDSELDDEKLEVFRKIMEDLDNEIALDDYGAGFSNINNLLRYMPQYVKIDRMLITDIQNSPQKQHFVKSIISFAHDNSITALAEGVETKEELKECINLGVDLIQGYYTGRPGKVPVTEIDPEISKEIRRYYAQYLDWEMHLM